MYDMIRENIEGGGYDLRDMLLKIDRSWYEGSLDATERDALKAYAREQAVPEDSYASPRARLTALEVALKALEDRVAALEGAGGCQGANSENIAEWKQPTGAHDAYMVGDRVTFGGKTYECRVDGCVWSPTDYPAGWKEASE